MLRFSDFLNFETAAMSAKGRTVRWQPIFERKQPPMAEVEEPGVRQDVTHASRPDYPGRRSGAGSLIAASASAVSATTALAFAMPLAASSRK